MKYIEALEDAGVHRDPSELRIFLAGGITDCPDWQKEIVAMLLEKGTNAMIMNPRRAKFPIRNPKAAEEQIRWEYRHLERADAILFWFPKETLCPIVLYELGAWSMTSKPIFVGIHPSYKRLLDIEFQTSLQRPDVKPVYGLRDLSNQVLAWEAKEEASAKR